MSSAGAAPAAGEPARPAAREARTRLRREEIVAAAARIFATAGYHNVGMRDIADAVGIRGASLYHHFPSKEEILYAVCLSVTREPNEENLLLLDAPGTPSQRMAALVRAHLRHLHRRRVEHLVGLHELNSLAPEHRAEIDGYRRYYQRRVRDVVVAGVRTGEFRVPDARLAAFGLLDMLNGISNWFHDDGVLGLEQVVDGYVELIVGRMLGSSGPY
ncbi:TetR/AcrR family transcriptional regulator [Pseudonocardia bannensis]|uniref:TetR/AcrR family transcriptional regulator n=1 Tax=Pseudonocardia bannensis TaxID=630973 RepID=A0A848DIX7_9PSEU|nr:TetR family transcriptional regulator [Pseudonocardia bannensis]NMH92525.1 TetR/AcrR family transcriptional regulator [Pseudonocardia bannensis]